MKKNLRFILFLPFLQVFVQVGIASSFPQLTEMFGSTLLASTFIGITPLVSILFGSFWGRILESKGESKTFLYSMALWSTALYLSGMSMKLPILAIVFRALQGIADSALFSNALTVITKADFSEKEQTKYFGLIEFLASFGAVMGPLVIGTGFIYMSYYVLMTVGIILFITTLFVYKQLPVIEIHLEKAKKQVTKFSPRIFLAAFFGILTLAVIVGFQATMPFFIEKYINNPIFGKIYISIFALALMLGNLFKHKISGIKIWIPLTTFATLILSMFVGSNSIVGFLFLIIISGLFLGLSLTMSSEYASYLSVGFEEKGMAVFSAFRISGNFFGPYLSIFYSIGGMNFFILALSLISLVSTFFLFNFKKNFNEIKEI
ncbi:Major Facilitator Superfamily protein [Marinitoga hydrogenitolerans DSM 16785]|uniref:Major Facilitator Superfamily protein n=1 Tax=Marinitoga hydrogenitolerans (strain DSM 16785 / JCM 12826 / AT1271) TaxID=1122195 RepID=A0A1M4ZRE3_MARH1|nr:MFS transporter [Marinitoga hydrogenitolerans]SHF20609.1 Major Facilitator Superfamily protein [Marinitoga hydrogenitolerans DSM 16785]